MSFSEWRTIVYAALGFIVVMTISSTVGLVALKFLIEFSRLLGVAP